MLVASGLIWIFVAVSYNNADDVHTAEVLFRETLEFYVELFLFLLASTTYLNAMSERGVFANIRHLVMSRGSSLNTVYWVCGGLTFFIFGPVGKLRRCARVSQCPDCCGQG